MSRIGFIGMGIMGRPMARNLVRAGHQVTVYNRTPGRTDEVAEAGAAVARTPRECASGKDVVITIVTDSPDVEAVLFGRDGVAEGAARGAVIVDMSTISPDATRDFAGRLAEIGVDFLDAPVSGGDIGAQKGTLTIMVGGEPAVFDRVRDVFEAMGSRVTLVGPVGAGQATKSCNQILCAVNMLAVCEALAFARKSGLDLAKVHQVVTGGAANSWALEHLGAAMVAGDFNPGFMVKLIAKDLNIVLGAARDLHVPVAAAALATQYFQSNLAHGEGELGTQAMLKVLERLSGTGKEG